ncbi:fork head domain protein [Dictyocaulus viviparus]|uniref:Fork head domain protein n=1 Tax=Dictyocaulus viviparus TaxID=29172 RepID=A0A0D8XXJ7_DICVI|nr:fork head domain protein [Dictyocaulus viviparus]
MHRSPPTEDVVHPGIVTDEHINATSTGFIGNEDIDMQHYSGRSRSSHSYPELTSSRIARKSETVHESTASLSSVGAQIRAEYPVKVCATSFASSILRGNSWTVQANSSLQNQLRHSQSSYNTRVKPSVSYNLKHTDVPHPVKTGTQYGITASISRPKQVLGLTGKSNIEKRWIDEDITRYGSIEENCDDFDEWVERVDVSKFAQDISVDLMSRPKTVKKEKNQPVASPYPKPGWSYSNLIALALKNSETGQLTVSEIYAFMLEHFPYFRTAPSGWKNSVRHNLSLNKCFCKVELDEELSVVQQARKSCLWMINPERVEKVEHDIRKWRERNPDAATEGMARPVYIQVPYTNQINDSLTNEDATAAEDLRHIIENECKSESDDIAVNHNILISTIKPEHGDDYLSDYLKPTVSEETMETTFPPTDILAGPSTTGSNKRQRTDSFYNSYNELPVMDLLPSVFVDAFLNLTPPKAKRLDREESVSPIEIESGFRHAHDALNDNSLLAAALEQSPYKMPVTFPVL